MIETVLYVCQLRATCLFVYYLYKYILATEFIVRFNTKNKQIFNLIVYSNTLYQEWYLTAVYKVYIL
jgi:hypothetical protein